jgi:hypothetical protein
MAPRAVAMSGGRSGSQCHPLRCRTPMVSRRFDRRGVRWVDPGCSRTVSTAIAPARLPRGSSVHRRMPALRQLRPGLPREHHSTRLRRGRRDRLPGAPTRVHPGLLPGRLPPLQPGLSQRRHRPALPGRQTTARHRPGPGRRGHLPAGAGARMQHLRAGVPLPGDRDRQHRGPVLSAAPGSSGSLQRVRRLRGRLPYPAVPRDNGSVPSQEWSAAKSTALNPKPPPPNWARRSK